MCIQPAAWTIHNQLSDPHQGHSCAAPSLLSLLMHVCLSFVSLQVRDFLLLESLIVQSFPAHAAEANMYKEDGTTMRSARIPITQDPQHVRAFRDEIALCVINEAKRLHPNAIKFHFNTLIQKVNLDRQTAHVSTGSHVTEVRSD